MLEVLLLDEHATGKPPPRQFADGGPGVEDRLPARFHRVGKLTVMTLQIEPFQALKAGQEPGLG